MKRDLLVPLTEARTRLFELVREAQGRVVVLLRHGRPVAVMLSAEKWENVVDRLEDLEDVEAVANARALPPDELISWEDVETELDAMDRAEASKRGGISGRRSAGGTSNDRGPSARDATSPQARGARARGRPKARRRR